MSHANDNANPNSQPTAAGYFCPTCGAADVTASGLAGGAAKCNVCTWTGTVEELATFRFTHDMGSPEEVFRAFFADMRRLISQEFAIAVGQLLIKWGFMDAPDAKSREQVRRTLARYVGVSAKAISEAIIRERQVIEREKHVKQPSA
jgi:hypothetical protein